MRCVHFAGWIQWNKFHFFSSPTISKARRTCWRSCWICVLFFCCTSKKNAPKIFQSNFWWANGNEIMIINRHKKQKNSVEKNWNLSKKYFYSQSCSTNYTIIVVLLGIHTLTAPWRSTGTRWSWRTTPHQAHWLPMHWAKMKYQRLTLFVTHNVYECGDIAGITTRSGGVICQLDSLILANHCRCY